MDWSDSPQQAEFRASARSFISERLPDYYRGRSRVHGGEDDWQQDFANGTDEAKAAAKRWAEALAERGWGAPQWPKEYGGGGLSALEQYILAEEMAQQNAPVIGGAGVTHIGPTLLVHGTDEQRKQFMGPTLRGEILWAQGFSEPGAGSDLGSLQCRAVRDGDEYVINGQKLWTSAGHKANWIFGLFRTDPEAPKHRGISFLLLDARTEGVSVRPIISMAYEHATNETFYENVRVPAGQLVGEENRGWYVGMTLLDFERSGIAQAVFLRGNIEELVTHLRSDERSRSRPAFPRSDVADRYIEANVLLNLSRRIASMQAAGLVPNYEASMGKIFRSELAQRISRTGTKAFGLHGMLWDGDEAPLNGEHAKDYCRSVVGTIAAGSNEIQRNIIAGRGLGLPRG
ncbi:MAG: acyl-CoA dehydrogenase family protein [Dehalococcoidia bacterium]|nr:acyl-CoA dehydrogenase family protein [Dehalococcoidia bacterium]